MKVTKRVQKRLIKVPRKGIGRPGPELSIAYLTDPKELTKLLNHFTDSSDSDYAAEVNETGGRAALWVLRQKALQGDVRALDIYLKHYYDWQRSQVKQKAADSAVEPASYVETRVESLGPSEPGDGVS